MPYKLFNLKYIFNISAVFSASFCTLSGVCHPGVQPPGAWGLEDLCTLGLGNR